MWPPSSSCRAFQTGNAVRRSRGRADGPPPCQPRGTWPMVNPRRASDTLRDAAHLMGPQSAECRARLRAPSRSSWIANNICIVQHKYCRGRWESRRPRRRGGSPRGPPRSNVERPVVAVGVAREDETARRRQRRRQEPGPLLTAPQLLHRPHVADGQLPHVPRGQDDPERANADYRRPGAAQSGLSSCAA